MEETSARVRYTVEGVGQTPAIMLLESPRLPRSITLAEKPLESFEYSAKERLLWIRFENEPVPRELTVQY